MAAATALPPPLRLELVGDGHFRAPNFGDPDDRDVVFGGQILAQAIIAANRTTERPVQTVHSVFVKAASVSGEALDLRVEPLGEGRSLSSVQITVSQGPRRCAQLLVVLSVSEPDLIRHAVAPPAVPGPEDNVAAEAKLVFPGTDVRAVGDANAMWTSEGPPSGPESYFWIRLPGGPDDLVASQAIMAWATDGFLIGTAMRRHGMGYDLSHRIVSTGVVSHSLTFHERFVSSDWLLLAHDSPFAGQGRSHGRGHVFKASGELLASFSQDSIIRHFPDAKAHADESRTIF